MGTGATARVHSGPIWTSFVGRAPELAVLGELVASQRWVAVVGPPGVGKTRLVDELVRRRSLAGALPAGGVVRVALVGVADASNAIAAIAAAAAPSVAIEARRPAALLAGSDSRLAIHDLLGVLESRGSTLLILDGVDALGSRVDALVSRLLGAVPALHVVTTALRRSGAGASAFDVTPLAEGEAVQVFADRARAARSDFELVGYEPVVRRIVRSLDCVPLAIELAAARMRVLTPTQLAGQPERLLGDPRGNPLHAALDACWSTLSDRERAVLGQLAVFRGGFDLDAAAAVVDLTDLERGTALDRVLSDLRDASLIYVLPLDGDAGALRFAMLELVREHATARCPDLATVRARHARCILARTRALLGERERAGGARAQRQLARERENLVAIVEGEDPSAALGAACVLGWAGLTTGPFDELAAVLARTLDRTGEALPVDARAEAWWLREELLRRAGRPEQATLALARLCELTAGNDAPIASRDSLPASSAAEGRRGSIMRARIACATAALAFGRGDVAAARMAYVEAIELAAHEPTLVVRALCGLGELENSIDHLDAGRSHFEGALAAAHAAEHDRGEACARAGLATTALRAGHLKQARLELERARGLHQAAGDRVSEVVAGGHLAVVAQLERDAAAAETGFRETLDLARAIGHRPIEATLLGYLGVTYHANSRLDQAAECQEAALALVRQLGNRAGEALVLARLGAVYADRADHAGAASALDAAEQIPCAHRGIATVIRMCRAHVDAKRTDGVAAALEELAAVVPTALDARLQAIVVARTLAGLKQRHQPLEICARGRWFRTPDGKRVGLERRGAPSRVLAYLAERRRTQPADVVPTSRIFEAGWPGAKATGDAAVQRVYTAIWTLRRLGLHDVILRVADGYFLNPKIPVVVRDD